MFVIRKHFRESSLDHHAASEGKKNSLRHRASFVKFERKSFSENVNENIYLRLIRLQRFYFRRNDSGSCLIIISSDEINSSSLILCFHNKHVLTRLLLDQPTLTCARFRNEGNELSHSNGSDVRIFGREEIEPVRLSLLISWIFVEISFHEYKLPEELTEFHALLLDDFKESINLRARCFTLARNRKRRKIY